MHWSSKCPPWIGTVFHVVENAVSISYKLTNNTFHRHNKALLLFKNKHRSKQPRDRIIQRIGSKNNSGLINRKNERIINK